VNIWVGSARSAGSVDDREKIVSVLVVIGVAFSRRGRPRTLLTRSGLLR